MARTTDGSAPRVELLGHHADYDFAPKVLIWLPDHLPEWEFEVVAHPSRGVCEVAMRPAGNDPIVVPPGGITARVLRSVNLGRLQAEARRGTAAQAEQELRAQARGAPGLGVSRNLSAALNEAADAATTAPSRPRPGPKGRSDLEVARICRDYVVLLDAGVETPLEALREQHALSVSQLRNILSNARGHQRDLLTAAPKRGKAGGELTDKAKRLLREAGEV